MPSDIAKAEQITFYSYWLPTLKPGKYSVSVTPALTADVLEQKKDEKPVAVSRALEASAVTEYFHVGGPRFALTGSEIYSCYPAPGQIGNFSDTLPHIVFDRCTLPWERTFDGADPTVPHDPWLALILLTDDDFRNPQNPEARVPAMATKTLKDVLTPGENIVGPTLTLAEYENESEICQTIDLPAAVFDAVMPRKDELKYLAHVREVETADKETWSLLKEGRFSVIICNRFPETQTKGSAEKDWGIVNTVLLISLEGWAEYLNDPAKLKRGQNYRLVVLGSWRFTCQGRSDLKSRMQKLNDESLLELPSLNGHADGLDLNKVFKMGFAPVNHALLNGDTTISWYRGPLAPMWYAKSMSYQDIKRAEAALRFDPTTGMLDASYAAAWQLGRLLALQDATFAQALYRFRTDYQRWIRRTNTEALEKSGIDAGAAKKLKKDLEPRSTRELYVAQLKDYIDAPQPAAAREDPPEPETPNTVQNWLGQAMLLYGVPFQYLVPDEKMLPAESIRFFYLNPEWLQCLLQGACSVGRASGTDELADQLLRARFFDVSQKLAFQLRSSAKQAADRRRDETEKGNTPPPAPPGPNDPKLHWPLSGYFLRSSAVESWIGLEAKARGIDASSNERLDRLQILRMDRLAPDILLCIYNGKVTEIEIKQPPEAVHFGAASNGRDGYKKTGLREIKDPQKLGSICSDTEIEEVPTRGKRVVEVQKLAAKIKDKLTAKDHMRSGDEFTSAEFAVEMIESPAKVIFTAK